MEHFPYKAVETIVEGMEAAVRCIEFIDDDRLIGQLFDFPQGLQRIPEPVRTDIMRVRDAMKRIHELRVARYLRA